jgi:dihydrolipoamide dehydrogenase
MSKLLTPKVVVIGGGPGGYVAAIRAGQLGLDTVLVDGDRLGGTCLIRGCIPSKALIHVAGLYADMTAAAEAKGRFGIHLNAAPSLDFAGTVRWKESIVDRLSGGVGGLLRKAKVKVVAGWAQFSDAKTCQVETAAGPVTIRAEHVILATGSRPVELPCLPFGDRVISSTEALSLDVLPQRLVVVGAGYIGLELGIAFAKLGVDVSIIEAQERILPLYDTRLTDPVRKWLDGHGVALHLGTTVLGLAGDALEVEAPGGERRTLAADKVLVTVGRKPHTAGWGIEAMALAMAGRFVQVDERCATSTTHVWAIGDLVGEPMLAHKASAQGEMVAEIIAGHNRRFDPAAIPAVCFTEPEIVSVGVDVAGDGHVVGQFPFQANGRALSMAAGDDGGFVRTIADAGSGRIVGIQAVGGHISELVGEFTALIEMGATLDDMVGMIHAHPTLGEAVHESALKALGHALHI